MKKEIQSDVETSTKPKIKKVTFPEFLKDKVGDIIETVLNKFEKFSSKNEDKKSLISSLVKIFAVLLTKKCNTLTKILKTIKLAAETALQLWSEQKQQ